MLKVARKRCRVPRAARNLSSLPPSERFNILFLGRDEFSCLVLRQVYGAKDVWKTLSICTQKDHRTGRRGHNVSTSPLKLLGQSLNLSVHSIPCAKSEFKHWKPPRPFYPLQETTPPPHHLLITASFGRILSKSHLELFSPSRRLNVHPSLLPAYRGPAPIQHAIIQNETETGVCITEMLERKAGIDSGDIWDRRLIPVPKEATFAEMRDISGKEGGELLVSVLRDMLRGKVVSTPQGSDGDAPRAPMITFEDTVVDPTAMTAWQIARVHRAIERPVSVRFRRDREDGKVIQLHGVSVITADDVKFNPAPGLAIFDNRAQSLVLGCRDNTRLHVKAVKQENKKLLPAREWWNGAGQVIFY